MLFRVLLLISLSFLSLSASTTYGYEQVKQQSVLSAFDVDYSFLHNRDFQDVLKHKQQAHISRFFAKKLQNAYLFLPMMQETIANSTLPEEFLFLAMAESGFSVDAHSHKRASGPWQFMSATGKKYGLHIDEYVDERRDLVKSTQAAVTYLEELHQRFDKWYLAALAYNCGEGCVLRAIKRAQTDDLETLIDPSKKYLPRETRNYIRKILAFAMVASDAEFTHLLNRAKANSIVGVDVVRGERVSRVAKMLGMKVSELKRLNSHLCHDFVPPYDEKYTLYIPASKLGEFNQKYSPSALVEYYISYRVKAGDNLSKIGKKYRVKYSLIQDFNDLEDTRLKIGQKLIIPVDATTDLKNGQYTVKKGDSLISIARAYKISTEKLKKINNLKGSLIRIGERLSIYD